MPAAYLQDDDDDDDDFSLNVDDLDALTDDELADLLADRNPKGYTEEALLRKVSWSFSSSFFLRSFLDSFQHSPFFFLVSFFPPNNYTGPRPPGGQARLDRGPVRRLRPQSRARRATRPL